MLCTDYTQIVAIYEATIGYEHKGTAAMLTNLDKAERR
jgi:hypothetical protein